MAYDGMERFFPADKIVKTGNPIRKNILSASAIPGESSEFFSIDKTKSTLLILGGSLGARRINQLIASRIDFFRSLGLQLIWQCGKLYYEQYKTYQSEDVRVYDFLNRMDLAYDAADIIISRAGAGSVSELCMVGKPVLFIPSPNVAEDHQTKNAQALVAKNAARMIRENELEHQFEEMFANLMNSAEDRETLGQAIKNLAMPLATEHIADEIEELIINDKSEM